MDCREFRSRIEDALTAPETGEFRRHADGCPACRQVHRRAGLIRRALAEIPADAPGAWLDEAVLRSIRRPARPGLGGFLRVAAAVLVLASGGIAALLGLSPGRARESLALRVVVETAAEGDIRDLALEEMYGPRANENHVSEGENGATMR